MEILPSYGFLENLHFLKVTTAEVDLGTLLICQDSLGVLEIVAMSIVTSMVVPAINNESGVIA